MAEGKINMFGKTYNTIGSTDSNFIIKTKGDLKVQWGNKYIDIIKNGKISSEESKILFIVDSVEKINKNGLYIVTKEDTNEIWVCIDSIKIQINNMSESNTYVSFLAPQEVSYELKHQALTNIGFYYNSIEDAKLSEILSGIIYIENESKLYIVKNGVLSEYKMENNVSEISKEEETESDKHPLYIEGYSLWEGDTEYIKCSSGIINIYRTAILYDMLLSSEASDDSGYRLYIEEGQSILELDTLRLRIYPNRITHSLLMTMIEKKQLNPKMYYLLYDFLNPWEVTWDNEPLYYEDEYKEINGEQQLSNIRNALQLIVRAANEELLEKLAWSPLHPDWIIHYDPYFLGEEHILAEDNVLYGYRSRKNASNETVYLPCKGQITYLKDEYGNEGNFNFRHLQFKRRVNYSSFVWRYCMDLSEDDVKLLGTFFPGTNNKFNFKDLEIFVQVFLCNPVKNNEGIVTDYEITNKDYNIQVSLGYSLYINSLLVESNIFENLTTNRLTHEVIGTKIIENLFIDIKRVVISEQEEIKNNIVKNSKFECRITGEFNDNYLDTITVSNSILVEKDWKFNKNTIINSLLSNFILNTSGEFIGNTVKDSKITMQYGIVGGIIQDNIFNNIILTLSNNGGTIINNEIINSQRLNITNTSNIEGNYFGEPQTILNSGSLINNVFDKITSITNKGTSSKNRIIQLELLQNTGEFNNNTIETSEKINNTGTMENNNIISSISIINSGTLSSNNIKQITLILNNSGTISNNNIEEAQSLTISKLFSNNTINKIAISNLSINYNFIGNHIHDINSITISADITNNNINDINGTTSVRGLMNNNSFKDINSVLFYKLTENNIFNNSLSDCNFLGETTNNISYKDIKSMTVYGNLQSCMFKLAVNIFSVRGMENCTLEEINTLSFSYAIYNTTTYGVIGNITRALPVHELNLLKDPSKKTEIYPNIEVICVPDILLTGMIIMWYGNVIPKGWWICDGTHGTPDLRDLFIRSAKSISDVGFSNNDHLEDDTNKIKLLLNQLPEHSHPHKEHTHKIDNLVASTKPSTVSVSSSGSFANSDGSTSVSSGVEGASTKSVINDVDYATVYSSGGSHTHTVNLSGSLESVSSIEDKWQYGTQQPILIEPRHFKLIFIMKIDEGIYQEA